MLLKRALQICRAKKVKFSKFQNSNDSHALEIERQWFFM